MILILQNKNHFALSKIMAKCISDSNSNTKTCLGLLVGIQGCTCEINIAQFEYPSSTMEQIIFSELC